MIIGLTGTKASGKGEAAKYIKEAGFIYFSLSDIVREEAVNRGLNNYTIKQLQDIGNELREKFGNGVLAERVIKKIKPGEDYIVDGIRNPGEIEVLRKHGAFIIGIDAPQRQRFERLIKRGRVSDPKTWPDFLEVDARDQQDKTSIGQHVRKCINMANIIIINNSTISDLKHKIKNVLLKLK